MQRRTWCVPLATSVALCLVAVAASAADREPAAPLRIDRRFDVLPTPKASDLRPVLAAAAEELGDWSITLAGVALDGPRLSRALARSDPHLTRALRETLRLPVDPSDLAHFLDDVLREGRAGLRGKEVFVPSGRARAAGILVHPQDVFGERPRLYGATDTLAIDRPRPPRAYAPAVDGEPLGPRWTMRFENPWGEAALLRELEQARPGAGYAERVRSLLTQLRAAGADVALTSTVRKRERGYLMWGAFMLSRAPGEREGTAVIRRLERANRDWGLGIDIRWRTTGGWRATHEAAREMADTYEVVYATEAGARSSNHYTGVAADFVAVALPRTLTLEAPDGARRTFDLSGPSEPRDLSLTPELVSWIEAHFKMAKLRSDYPHWDDATALPDASTATVEP
jgi:hypothetical protein